jgi:hypothetical protein
VNRGCAVLALASAVACSKDPPPPAPPPVAPDPDGGPTTVADFRLLDHQGRSWELDRQAAGARAVVVFAYAIDCPIARKSVAELAALRAAYADRGVVFWLLDARADTRADLVREAAEFAIEAPILLDEAGMVTRALGIKRTATAVVLQPGEDWRIAYRGAVDDRLGYGAEKPAPDHRWLADALDDVLAGRAVRTPRTAAKGCVIADDEAGPAPTYAADAGPILRERCAGCHNPGGPAWAMTGYDEVREWAPTIREVLLAKRMPPWFADPAYGEFKNDVSLPAPELRTLARWLEAGAPRGDGPDPLPGLAPRKPPVNLGRPDLLVRWSGPQTIPATGRISYRYMTRPTPAPNELLIRAVRWRIDNPRVVHHIQLLHTAHPIDAFPMNDHGRPVRPDDSEDLIAWAPGYPRQTLMGSDVALRVPPGRYVVAEVHYTTTGKPEIDRSAIALYLYAPGAAPPLLLEKLKVMNRDFTIPPGAPDFALTATHRLERDMTLAVITPHMHFRGKRMRARARFPDGTDEILLSVPAYDFNWQRGYRLAERRVLPAGTELIVDGAFDNSPANPANPDPARAVTWGLQSSDEMFVLYLSHLVPRE